MHLNFEAVNIFPRAAAFVRYLDRRLPDVPTRWKELRPGDALEMASAQYTWQATERVDEADFINYVQAYAAGYEEFFRELKGANTEPAGYMHLFDRLRCEMVPKLRHFGLSARMQEHGE